MIEDNKIKEFLRLKKDGYLHHRESQNLEFKEQFNLNGLADYFRDFAAFANNRGGFIIFGVKDNPYKLVGLSKKSFEQFNKIDPEKITGFLLDIFSPNIEWSQSVVKIGVKKFGVFYVNKSENKPIISKKDEGKNGIIKNGEIYYRYGGRTQKIEFAELHNIIENKLQLQTREWQNLISKIAKAGPSNAAILDTKKGIIQKDDSQILVIDDSLANKIKFIKQGDFSRKKGEITLRLVGDVQPINSVEVTKIEKQKLIEDYPYTALELVKKIQERLPKVTSSDVWKVIAENDLKNIVDYSAYNFRSKKQETEWRKSGVLPSGTPNIYNDNSIDFIINILRNK